MYEQIEQYVDRLLRESTPDCPFWNIESIKQGKKPHWNYIDGCMLTALLQLHKITHEQRYFNFVENFVDYYVFENGTIRGYDKSTYNLDDINEGKVLFELYQVTGKRKYKLAIDLLKSQLDEHPRTVTGSFWHKLIYPNQVWLDGLYMAQGFSAMWQRYFGGKDYSDVVHQIENVYTYMYDSNKQLFYHGLDCSREAFWCDKTTGLSRNFWLRAMGWFLVAMADFLEICDDDVAKSKVAKVFGIAIDGVAQYVDADAHMLYQVVDCGGKPGNYLETSGSSMVAYAMLKGARLGVIDAKYSALGKSIFDGICTRYLDATDGELNLGGICLVAGLGPESNRRRDGSYEYYISEPIVDNDAKGVAPFVLCYTEVKQLG